MASSLKRDVLQLFYRLDRCRLHAFALSVVEDAGKIIAADDVAPVHKRGALLAARIKRSGIQRFVHAEMERCETRTF